MYAAFGGAHAQGLCTRCGIMQAVLGTMSTGGALVCHQRFDMSGVFDLRTAVEAAWMGGDHLVRIEDTYRLECSEHQHRVVYMGYGG